MSKTYLYPELVRLTKVLPLRLKLFCKHTQRGGLFEEKALGTNTARLKLQEVIRHIDKDDMHVVWKMNLFAR